MRLKFSIILAGLLCMGSAFAWKPPQVQYSAMMTMETDEEAINGMVYFTPGKERREYIMEGEKTAMIIRQDKKVVWMLIPEDEMYMEMKFDGGDGKRKDDINNYQIEQTTVGEETVNGIKTTKSKVIMRGPKNEKMGGFWWTSKDGIIVKMDVISVDKKAKDRMKMELTNLKVGKQDAKLFEIPSGYESMSMGGLGNMFKGGDDKDDDKEQDNKSFGVKDAMKLFR